MAKRNDSEGYDVGNTDDSKRGRGKRPERESGGSGSGHRSNKPRGSKPEYGDVTKNPKKD